MDPAPPDPALRRRETTDPPSDEGLFDEFLDQALAGEASDPAAFCRARGIDGAPPWLHQLHDLVQHSARVPPAADGTSHKRLGDYVLLRRLGEGGMGVVYLAEQQSLRRHVALKVVRPELAGSATALQRFEREARALARLRHPGIATVYASGEADGVHFLAMELIPGRDLASILRDGPVELRQVVRWLRDIAEALAAAHAAAVLHRDVKPANIRIGPEGRAVLMDFGLARDLEGTDVTLTRTFAGSPAYAAPEQLTGARPVDVRTDVYGLGATLYECLCGVPPFPGETMDQVMRRVLTEDPVPVRRRCPAVPRDLDAVVRRALERDPRHRYDSAAAFAADLEAILQLRPVRARRPGPWRLLRGWTSRHRLLAMALGAGLLVVATVASVLVVGGVRERAERHQEAARLVTEARAALLAHDAVRAAAADAAEKLRALDTRLVERWLNPGEETARQRFTAAVSQVGSEREQVFARVLGALNRARSLDPTAEGLDRGWAEMHFQQWLDLRQRDPQAAAVHLERVRELDRAGDLVARVLGVQSVSLVSEPAGAEVWLYTWRGAAAGSAEGERRLVPVASGMDVADALVLRSNRDQGGLRAGDLVTRVGGQPVDALAVRSSEHPAVLAGSFLHEVDGQPPMRDELDRDAADERTFVFADPTGSRIEVRGAGLRQLGIRVEPVWQALRRGTAGKVALELRRDGVVTVGEARGPLDIAPTATAVEPVAAARLGTTPLPELVLQPGSYLAVLRLPGHLDYRLPFHVDHAVEAYSRPQVYRTALQREAPPGFVPIGGEAFGLSTYFLQQNEVSNGEYLEFCNNQPEPAAWSPHAAGGAGGSPWPSGPDGRMQLPPAVDPEQPVTGMSWTLAQRYAAWFTQHRGLDDSDWVYDLPTFAHYLRAGHGGDGRLFVHGFYFNPKWIKSRFARRTAGLEPVLSYPLDESPYGVYDLQGSVAEWAADETNPQSEGTRIVFGGSWWDSLPSAFQLRNYRALPPESQKPWVGFRLVLRRR